MNNNHSGRLWIVFGVVYLALSCIFPDTPPSLFWIFEPSKTSLRLDLEPGIDMVGGTSLTYEIKPPEGGYHGEGTLAESVASALKRRVDPLGQRNLIWRPQGNNRLEIQLPRRLDNADATAIRKAYLDAQQNLESTNVREAEVTRVVEQMRGTDRDKRLAEMAGANVATRSPTRGRRGTSTPRRGRRSRTTS
jgi:preprotein translocase subunit SecD